MNHHTVYACNKTGNYTTIYSCTLKTIHTMADNTYVTLLSWNLSVQRVYNLTNSWITLRKIYTHNVCLMTHILIQIGHHFWCLGTSFNVTDKPCMLHFNIFYTFQTRWSSLLQHKNAKFHSSRKYLRSYIHIQTYNRLHLMQRTNVYQYFYLHTNWQSLWFAWVNCHLQLVRKKI